MPLPARGGVFTDARRPERTCRVSWHPERGIFSISIWQDSSCLATFQLPQERLSELMAAFVNPLTDGAQVAEAKPASG